MHTLEQTSEKMKTLKQKARKIKLLATDLDGTLLNSKHMLSDENRSALSAVAQKGITLVTATGRSRKSIPDTLNDIDGLKYLITCNGARIHLHSTDEVIYEKYITREAIDYVSHFFNDEEVMCVYFWDGAAYVSEKQYVAARDYGIPRWYSDYFFFSRNPVKDFKAAILENIDKIENINFCYGKESVQNRVLAFLEARTDLYELTSSFPFNYEINGVGVTKSASVDFIAKLEGILPEETICFGDNDNDASMIEYAGIGVATANATPLVISAADFVSTSNEDSGVAAALKTLGMI